ncbi:Cyclophilin-type peptidyl-prolyl cis-trans isomerase domain [Trinorchestia longiramus]|nr:Cyclophilin-type peptidyl-prolyl cis-trans isomerase domain [Trinorchestia longiramus]
MHLCRYGSQFFVTLEEDLHSLDSEHLVFGQVTEGLDVVAKLNDVLTDEKNRPYQDILVTHTVVLDDPYPDPDEVEFPDASPQPTAEMLASDYIGAHEDIQDTAGKDIKEIEEEIAQKEAQARATILEMVGDLPDADMAPPENVLFVCKLNPITTSEDLEIIFSRFGKIVCTEVIRDHVTGKSLQYAFIEFQDKKSCEAAYFKMDNVLIDDRRIHVDFSQSVSKVKWRGKGRGVMHFDDKGKRVDGRAGANTQNLRAKEDGGKPKSRFIDAAAYQKKYEEAQGYDRPGDNRHRNGERSRKDERMPGEERSNFARSRGWQPRHPNDRQPRHPDDRQPRHPDDRQPRHPDDRQPRHPDDRQPRHPDDRQPRQPDDRQPRHPDDRQPRHPDDRQPRHPDDRSNRYISDRSNRYISDRNDEGNVRYRDDRSNSHRGRRHDQVEERQRGGLGELECIDRRDDDHDRHNPEQRRHVVSKRRSSSLSDDGSDKEKRRKLMGQLRSDLGSDKIPTKKKKTRRGHVSDSSSSPRRSQKLKKKKLKRSKKRKDSSSESSDSDSDKTPIKKHKKSSKKKKKKGYAKSSSSSSSTSDSEEESRRKKKGKKH